MSTDPIPSIVRVIRRGSRGLSHARDMAHTLLRFALVSGNEEMIGEVRKFLVVSDELIVALGGAADELLDPKFLEMIMSHANDVFAKTIAEVTKLRTDNQALTDTNKAQTQQITDLQALAVDPANVTAADALFPIDATVASSAPADSVAGAAAPVATATTAPPAV